MNQATPQSTRGTIVLLSTQLGGGIGRVIDHLSRGFVEQGYRVDVLLDRDWGDYVDSVRQNCNVRRLHSTHAWSGIPELAHYLRKHQPVAVITDSPRLTHLAIRSARFSTRRPCIAAVIHSTYSLKFTQLADAKRIRRVKRMSKLYPLADRIIAVSEGVADDFARHFRVDRDRIDVIHNPVIPLDGIPVDRNADPVSQFRKEGRALIMALGRLTPAKDFPTLLRAFALLRQERDAYLVLFGEGKERTKLTALASGLGIADSVALPGYTDEPYAALAGADLFVLSSQWEGFGNVLVEAMAVGTPVVSTDCPSGPREILEDGRWGRLVPPGDEAELARAMLATLETPIDASRLRAAAARYHTRVIAKQYLQTLGLSAQAADAGTPPVQ